MAKFREKMWLWAHDAGIHNAIGLPRPSKMTPLEGAMYLGIPNAVMVVNSNLPEPPFDREARALDCLDNVVWSIIGDGSSKRNYDGNTDTEAVAQIAKEHSNIIGGALDDFFSPARIKGFSPEKISEYKRELSEKSGKYMQLWSVIYTHELNDIIVPYLDDFDVSTLWTWKIADIPDFEKNIDKLRKYWGYEKPIFAGCYLWGYGDDSIPMPREAIKKQLDTYYKCLKAHKIDGVIFCSNTVCDLGLEAVEIAKNWIAIHSEEELSF